MLDALKTIFRRLSGALMTVVGAVFGQWHPPFWLRAIGHGLANLGNKARAYPRQAGAGAVGLVLLAAAGFYGWHWYANLPQPHTVGYSLHKPNLTDYTQQPAAVDNLQVRFAESVAPLAAIGKPVTDGIMLKPTVAGAWRWSDDRTLVFTPEKDWPIDAHYTLDLSKKTLLADGILLNQYSSQFSTQPFRASLAQNELYQDPSNPTLKQLVATFRFLTRSMKKACASGFRSFSAKASPTATPSYPTVRTSASTTPGSMPMYAPPPWPLRWKARPSAPSSTKASKPATAAMPATRHWWPKSPCLGATA